MKTSLLLIFTFLSLVSISCNEQISNDCSSDSNLGFLDVYRPPLIQVGSITLGNEIDIGINVLWIHGCIYESYFEVVKQQGLTYHFILKDRSKGCECTDNIRQTYAPFKFKPTQKGTHTLVIIDRKDTITSTIEVN
jgi:hypothetical protein